MLNNSESPVSSEACFHLRNWHVVVGRIAWLWIAGVIAFSVGCSDSSSTKPTPEASTKNAGEQSSTQEPGEAEKLAFTQRLRPQVEEFCGSCHVTPRADSVDRKRWPREVLQGFEFQRLSGRDARNPPSVEDVTKYFVYLAPETLQMPRSIVGNPPSRVKFEATAISKLAGKSSAAQPPCISQIKWMALDDGGPRSLIYCDLGTGSIYQFQPQTDDAPKLLAVLYQPTSFEPVDLDGDGRLDLVVADLGEFLAADSDLGRVVWLRRRANGDQFDEIVLHEGLGRVADVKPADFDGDGDIDILVSEFGWRTTGRILMLEQTSVDKDGVPKFDLKVIDRRHGTIETPLVDLNGDGHLDFVALISQEHEVVEAFINDGTGRFSIETLYRANDPTYGSSRIELADLDGDGDVDVVYANGDSFDSGSKPYHSVQWLENPGTFPFEHHHITYMPGVLAIKTADFDNDGDLDIVAGALMAERADESLEAAGVESLILLEQTAPREFKRTQIETSAYQHGAIEVGDFDGDDLIDIAVGNFLHYQPQLPTRQDFIIWKNLGLR
ncbi:FG-GAP repeat domain-containing protein [Novipirellula sp. SH528]|uniref:FG-GAP repeat domain-containing protein n=1 Tax=Novipirellula sp. SH528 TaxID=3454466 RepID=UPI003FA04044